ncbi:hypothetical protein [Streptomyces sp. NPDC006134]|uniref:hypothetical protein n=1 Tax=Streptomyces sp. NPDC006134 TaxID=3154467 RepID=UPI0033D43BF2
MPDAYSHPDPEFTVATLGRALRELLATFISAAPEHDADGGEHTSWWLVLRPADDDQAGALLPTATPEGSPYAVQLPAGSVRILTRLVMDLWHHEQQSTDAHGLCQMCGQGRALSVWRPR